MSALGLESKGRWFEPTVRHYFSSNNVRLLAYTSLHPFDYTAFTVSGKVGNL